MKNMERIKLDRDYVKSIIPTTKTIKEMAELCGCCKDKMRHFIIENGLYKYYCEQHKIKYNPQIEELKCDACGSKIGIIRYHGTPYCKRHYLQMFRHGKIFESTIYDRNEIIIKDNYAIIIIKNIKQEPIAESIIDLDDVEKIKQYKWYISGEYCVTKAIDPSSGIDMANVIFDNYKDKYDHINHNRLDNRKINLRPVTSHQNAMNMGKKCTNKSGVTGVRREKTVKEPRWIAQITYDYENKWLGSYDTFDKAVGARLEAEIKYFGEYSPNYNPESKTIQLDYYSQTDNKNHFVEYSLQGELLKWS